MVQHASKPFDIQSPQKIAMEYGGNKQKIAQAMQLGVVDSTAGVLAGMFIDKMRSAQMQEQAQQPTIAQQVMGGAQPSPAAGAPPAGGLGAASQGAPPMAPSAPPQGGMPPAPPMGAPPQGAPPMGMAEGGMVPPYAAGGGLSDLPVPDTMFDEPDNGGYGDGYSGGGLVAFADGGDVDPLGWMHGTTVPGGRWGAKRGYGPHSGLDLAGSLGSPVGAVAPGVVVDAGRNHTSGNYVLVQHPDGHVTSYAELDSVGVKKGDPVNQGTVLGTLGSSGATSTGPHVHFSIKDPSGKRIDPTPFVSGKQPFSFGAATIPERDIGTAAGRFGAPMDIFEALQKRFGPTPEEQEIDTARMARAKELASPEYQDKIRKQDMWEALAQIGFNMASSKSPYLLQAVGEAAAAALPGARVARKEREALKDRALDAMASINGMKRKDNLALFGAAVDMAKAGQQQEQFEVTKGLESRRLDLTERELQDMREYRNAQLGIEAYKAKHPNMSDLESAVNYFLEENPGMTRTKALEEVYRLRQQYGIGAGGAGGAKTAEEIRAMQEGRGGASTTSGGAQPVTVPWTQ